MAKSFRSHSLLHETAWQTAADVVRALALTDEQRRDKFAEVYAAVRRGFDQYAAKADHMARRIGGGA